MLVFFRQKSGKISKHLGRKGTCNFDKTNSGMIRQCFWIWHLKNVLRFSRTNLQQTIQLRCFFTAGQFLCSSGCASSFFPRALVVFKLPKATPRTITNANWWFEKIFAKTLEMWIFPSAHVALFWQSVKSVWQLSVDVSWGGVQPRHFKQMLAPILKVWQILLSQAKTLTITKICWEIFHCNLRQS